MWRDHLAAYGTVLERRRMKVPRVRISLPPPQGNKMSESDILIAIQAVSDVIETIGIHPASVTKNYGIPEEETIPRVTWKDGWNACMMEMSEKVWDQLEELRKGIDENFALLALIDAGWYEGDKFVLNINDTFHYACADAETVDKEQAKEIVRLFKKHGFKGIDYWVATQRGYDPKVPHYKERVETVRAIEGK